LSFLERMGEVMGAYRETSSMWYWLRHHPVHFFKDGKYEDISNGMKVKVIYVRNNPMGINVISFIEWPEEFNKVVQIDYEKMINNFFIGKISTLLEPMGRLDILDMSSKSLDLFF